MPLKSYRKKRNFDKTPEPYGSHSDDKTHQYLIQKHAASHLHYDFRLEIDGVLKSWAIPKGPSLDPSVKRLAVHVEDHPLEYASFEGVIPKGEYGGGTVMLWDQGTWTDESTGSQEGYQRGNLKIALHGKKLKGGWKLIQIKSDPKNWLLIKVDDRYARIADEYDILEEKPLSVVSKKNLDQIARSKKPWQASPMEAIDEQLVSQKKLPKLISPQLATLVKSIPEDYNWLHEVKFDGYRLISRIGSDIKLMTRGQQDWTAKFPHLVDALAKLDVENTILDGEIVSLDKNNLSNFQDLQNAINSGKTNKLVYYVFDILYYQGYDVTQLDILQRKALLKNLIPVRSKILKFSDHEIGDGQTFFHDQCQRGGEGVISKEIESTYIQKRTKNWVKTKCVQRQELVVAGFTEPQGARQHFGALILGYYARKKLIYCGRVGTGFDQQSLAMLWKLLKKSIIDESPFAEKVPSSADITWVKPNIVVEVEFREWTGDDVLRHSSFKGIRMDKDPTTVRREGKS